MSSHRMFSIFFLCIMLSVFFAMQVSARVWRVPYDEAEIKMAIDKVESEDIIEIYDCQQHYINVEATIRKDNVTIRAADNNIPVIICNCNGAAIYTHRTGDFVSGTVFSGLNFIVQNGEALRMSPYSKNTTVENCYFDVSSSNANLAIGFYAADESIGIYNCYVWGECVNGQSVVLHEAQNLTFSGNTVTDRTVHIFAKTGDEYACVNVYSNNFAYIPNIGLEFCAGDLSDGSVYAYVFNNNFFANDICIRHQNTYYDPSELYSYYNTFHTCFVKAHETAGPYATTINYSNNQFFNCQPE
ncbi:MAG: hypothetical protein JW795_22075 [Chitinivibrionales bacterium]|nr:hypothetical protein [Chitinivibrionales bacterium]